MENVIDDCVADRSGRRITLTEITDDNWRAVADVVPADDQRRFVPPAAARYLLLSMREQVWNSVAICADGSVVGHAMWGWDDDDQCYWIGGVLVDAGEQGQGIARAAMRALARWLFTQPVSAAIRLSYEPTNAAARRLYTTLGFRELDVYADDEIVAELSRERAAAVGILAHNS